MKFNTTSYHYDLLKDEERLAVFFEAISQFANKNNTSNQVAFDIGCGSGVLSFFAADFFNKILAIEIDSKVAKLARNNLEDFKNIEVINNDATTFDFPLKADLIICEMLDTALIDEEQVPSLINARKYLKCNGKIIPEAIINMAELVNMSRVNICYDDVDSNTNCAVLSNQITYDEINFLDDFSDDFNRVISFNIINDDLPVNGIKLTTYTKLLDDIICGPTPMLNPPLLIPLKEREVNCGDLIKLKLKYNMGKGIETIEVDYDGV